MTYFWQILNTNLKKIIQRIFYVLNILKNILKIFPNKQSPKQVAMAPINMIAPI